MQAALELGKGLPQSAYDQVLERLSLEQPQRCSDTLSKWWWKCSMCLRMYSSSPYGSGKRNRPGNSLNNAGDFFDLLEVEEERRASSLSVKMIA